MENINQLLIALSCAVGAISFFVILRRTMRSPSTHAWFSHTIVATASALLLTGAFAGSLYFVGYTLQTIMPTSIAFFATFAVHLGIFAACSYVLPAEEYAKSEATIPQPNQTAGASA